MLALHSRKFLVRVARVFFYEGGDAALPDADVLFLSQSAVPMGSSREFRTLHLDLTLDEATLLAQCAKTTQYEVRRATTRDPLSFVLMAKPTEDELRGFLAFQRRFARAKGLKPASECRVRALARAGALRLSVVRDAENADLCWHGHVVDGRRARLLYSASHFRDADALSVRALLGRANRGLHWVEIVRFKTQGLSVYDFGGLALDSADPGLRRIAEFKAGFGGKPVTEFHCSVGRTLLGRLALRAQRGLAAGDAPDTERVEGATRAGTSVASLAPGAPHAGRGWTA
jgi:hypothetical protein